VKKGGAADRPGWTVITSRAGALQCGAIQNRLRHLMELEGWLPVISFSPHALRRACATHD
jgi:hypothetical protein